MNGLPQMNADIKSFTAKDAKEREEHRPESLCHKKRIDTILRNKRNA
jgi:hypothetical protein